MIARAQKTNKLFLGVELNKQLSGLESPGVNTYNPNRETIMHKSPSTVFGKEERTMSHIKPLLDRSPGPVYSQVANDHSGGISFTKARRSSSIEPLCPAPWDYNPVIASKIPTYIIKESYERHTKPFLTPGPGSYILHDVPARGVYVSKVGRSIVGCRDSSPGPGKYETHSKNHSFQASFGSCKRSMDPRDCKNYVDAKSYELYRNGKD